MTLNCCHWFQWTVIAIGIVLASPAVGGANAPEGDGPTVDRQTLSGKRFQFYWKSADGGALNGIVVLHADGAITGIAHPNEATWTIDAAGKLVFRHTDGRVSTRFDTVERVDGALYFEGPFALRDGIVHYLKETELVAKGNPHSISPAFARKNQYSRQQFIYLDVGESLPIRLPDGTTTTIRLNSVTESKDSVVSLIRSAQVVVEVKGQPLTLTCAPYVMPTLVHGLRIQADTTSAWMELPKRVQLSVWAASDPIVDTERFRFPLPDYALFSHGTQAYNEPVHLGHGDGDPAGQRFYHDYGVDLAGYEARQEVVSCIDGNVVQVERQPGTLAIQDDRGLILVFGHLDTILDGIQVGTRVKRGQMVGMLGKRGASGNFSHLHVGTYLSKPAMLAGGMNQNLNLYPWLVAAYRAESGVPLQAVARPHHTVRVGETVVLNGAQSWSRDAEIASFQWRFHDGTSCSGPVARKVFDAPGCYMAQLQIEDRQGRVDVDYARVRVFSDPVTEPGVPTLFVTRIPARSVRVGEQVEFRLWPQGGTVTNIAVDFNGERRLRDYQPYTAVSHAFTKSGLQRVTVTGLSAGMPITQQIKVLVRGP